MKYVADQSYYHVQFIILYHLLKPNLFPSKCLVLTGVSFSHSHITIFCVFAGTLDGTTFIFQLPVRLPIVSHGPSQFCILRPFHASFFPFSLYLFGPEFILLHFSYLLYDVYGEWQPSPNATGTTVDGPLSPLIRTIANHSHRHHSYFGFSIRNRVKMIAFYFHFNRLAGLFPGEYKHKQRRR